MNNALLKTPPAENEPVYSYAPGSADRAKLKAELEKLLKGGFDVPLVIGGKEVRTGKTASIIRPDARGTVLGRYHMAGEAEAKAAVEAALAAKKDWEETPWEERAAIFRKVGDLAAGKYRPLLVASTMLNQSKTAQQAEIDAACEAIDYYRVNPTFMESIYAQQPENGLKASFWLPDGPPRTAWLSALKMKSSPTLPEHVIVDGKGDAKCFIDGAVEEGDYPQLWSSLR